MKKVAREKEDSPDCAFVSGFAWKKQKKEHIHQDMLSMPVVTVFEQMFALKLLNFVS
jgi:hypothetical protein